MKLTPFQHPCNRIVPLNDVNEAETRVLSNPEIFQCSPIPPRLPPLKLSTIDNKATTDKYDQSHDKPKVFQNPFTKGLVFSSFNAGWKLIAKKLFHIFRINMLKSLTSISAIFSSSIFYFVH